MFDGIADYGLLFFLQAAGVAPIMSLSSKHSPSTFPGMVWGFQLRWLEFYGLDSRQSTS